MITPPNLQQGDTIGLVCPAGTMPFERTVACIDTLSEWGFEVKIGKTVGSSHHYFSATDEERLADIQQMLDDPHVNAVMAARGGYGCSRIIDAIDWSHFLQHPKWLVGFSDLTVFNCHLFQNFEMASIHGPMAGAFHQYGANDEHVKTLLDALHGRPYQYAAPAQTANIAGTATGRLVGGNLSLLAHLIGSSSEVDTEGCMLFVEDVGEYLYNVDRMFLQLERAGKLKALSGLVVGGFTQMKDTTVPLGKTLEEIILEKVARYNYPVCFNFPVSHERENVALKVGLEHRLGVSDDGVSLAVYQEDSNGLIV